MPDTASPIDCIGTDEVVQRTGLSRATLFRRLKVRAFPQPVFRNPNRWRVTSIERWMERREAYEEQLDAQIQRLSEV